MASIDPIPTVPVWDVWGQEPSGNLKLFERFVTLVEAENRLRELQIIGENELAYSINERRSIVRDSTMPTEGQRRQLCDLMSHGFVELRKLGYGEKHQAIVELADVFHNLPKEMFQEELWDWNLLEAGLRGFEERFPDDKIYPFAAMLRDIRTKP